MKFTPSQTQVLAGLTAQTLRYWKKHLPPIAAKRGHSPCYTRGEVLALIVIRRLVRDFKMDVSVLGINAHKLFDVCSSSAQWQRLAPQWLVVSAGAFVARESLSDPPLADPAIVFPIDVAVCELDDKLTSQDVESQLELSLPPVVIRRTAVRRS